MNNTSKIFERCWQWLDSMSSCGVNKTVMRELLRCLEKTAKIPAEKQGLEPFLSQKTMAYASDPTLLNKAVSDLRKMFRQVSDINIVGGIKKGGWQLTQHRVGFFEHNLGTHTYSLPNLQLFIERLCNGELFPKPPKVLVIGDIAMDYSYKCSVSPYGYAAKHSNEEIFDIEAGGDDGGALGGCTNTALLLSSLGIQVSLMTTVGNDQEGERALALMKEQNLHGIFLQLPSVQTITRMRFFIHNPSTGAYDLRYRMNKEPNLFLAAQEARFKFKEKKFLDSFSQILNECDAIYINDTDKGFLTEETLPLLAPFVRDWSVKRLKQKRPALVIVDPKFQWEKYHSWPVSYIKANLREACRFFGIASNQETADVDHNVARQLVETAKKKADISCREIIVTLGDRGALYLRKEKGGKDAREVYSWNGTLFPAVTIDLHRFRATTGAGDLFGAAMVVAQLAGFPVEAAVMLGNYFGALQCTKITGQHVTIDEIGAKENVSDLLKQVKDSVPL